VGRYREREKVILRRIPYLTVARRRYGMAIPGYYRVEGWRVVPDGAFASRRRQVRSRWAQEPD
jgi:hypothetical protein